MSEHGPVAIRTPRDRDSSFEPRLVKKRQRRFAGFDDKILALYARGLSVGDIEAHLAERYGVSVGRDLISRVHEHYTEDRTPSNQSDHPEPVVREAYDRRGEQTASGHTETRIAIDVVKWARGPSAR